MCHMQWNAQSLRAVYMRKRNKICDDSVRDKWFTARLVLVDARPPASTDPLTVVRIEGTNKLENRTSPIISLMPVQQESLLINVLSDGIRGSMAALEVPSRNG